MSFKIAIASGKGGTGKTTVSVNLFYFISKYVSENVLLVDCDVEEPNDAIFFPHSEVTKTKEVFKLIPEIDRNTCTYCRKCVEYCEFNAIVVIPNVEFAEVNSSLCHSCGACKVACMNDSIVEIEESIGEINYYKTNIGNGMVEAKLKIGSAMQTLLIKKLKKEITDHNGISIYDAPPGTSCPVVETILDADYIILVTEPTPFGLYDLILMVELIHDMQKPFGVIINKAGLGNDEVYSFLKTEQIKILGEIPFLKDYAEKYASGDLLNNIDIKFEEYYKQIIDRIGIKID